MNHTGQSHVHAPTESGMQETIRQIPGLQGDDKERLDLDHYELPWSPLIANHRRTPFLVLSNGKISVNAAALRSLPDAKYVQLLINADEKRVVLKPCMEFDRSAIPWYSDLHGKQKPRQVNVMLFYMKLYDLMGWEPTNRCKIVGDLVNANDGDVLSFRLEDAAMYPCKKTDDGKIKTSKIPYYPAAWKTQFGIPYGDYKKSLHADLFDGYALFSISSNGVEELRKGRLTPVPPVVSSSVQLCT